jgi:hypothetical protein
VECLVNQLHLLFMVYLLQAVVVVEQEHQQVVVVMVGGHLEVEVGVLVETLLLENLVVKVVTD